MGKKQELQYKIQLYHLGRKIYNAFNARGANIKFKRIYANKSTPCYGFFEVDLNGLSTTLRPETLSSLDTEQFLSGAIGQQVKVMNGKNLIFCVRLDVG